MEGCGVTNGQVKVPTRGTTTVSMVVSSIRIAVRSTGMPDGGRKRQRTKLPHISSSSSNASSRASTTPTSKEVGNVVDHEHHYSNQSIKGNKYQLTDHKKGVRSSAIYRVLPTVTIYIPTKVSTSSLDLTP